MFLEKYKSPFFSSPVMNQCWLMSLSCDQLPEADSRLELADVYWLKVVITLRLLTQNSWIDSWSTYDPKTHFFRQFSGQIDILRRARRAANQLSKNAYNSQPRKVHVPRSAKVRSIIVTCQVTFEVKKPRFHDSLGQNQCLRMHSVTWVAWVSLSWAAPIDSWVWVGL